MRGPPLELKDNTSVVKIFINYRTADEPYGAALLDGALSQCFGTDVVFRAPKSIGPGDDFEQQIMAAAGSTRVLLAVIGPKWLAAADDNGNRRLDDPNDFVRREIATAFAHGVRVIPVLMNSTRISAAKLPPDISALAKCQDVRVHFRSSHTDLPILVQRLQLLVPELNRIPDVTDRAVTINAMIVKGVFREKVYVAGDFIIT